jgi:acetyl-CoA carboxylase biotin carboxyl carrier protein
LPTDVVAHITGTVWKIEKQVGDDVAEGDTLIILESMKMEMPVEAPASGKIHAIKIKEGDPVTEGAILIILV